MCNHIVNTDKIKLVTAVEMSLFSTSHLIKTTQMKCCLRKRKRITGICPIS